MNAIKQIIYDKTQDPIYKLEKVLIQIEKIKRPMKDITRTFNRVKTLDDAINFINDYLKTFDIEDLIITEGKNDILKFPNFISYNIHSLDYSYNISISHINLDGKLGIMCSNSDLEKVGFKLIYVWAKLNNIYGVGNLDVYFLQSKISIKYKLVPLYVNYDIEYQKTLDLFKSFDEIKSRLNKVECETVEGWYEPDTSFKNAKHFIKRHLTGFDINPGTIEPGCKTLITDDFLIINYSIILSDVSYDARISCVKLSKNMGIILTPRVAKKLDKKLIAIEVFQKDNWIYSTKSLDKIYWYKYSPVIRKIDQYKLITLHILKS